MAARVWLVGGPASPLLASLGVALESAGGLVVHRSDDPEEWSPTPGELPSLIIVESEHAWRSDGAFLDALEAQSPWRSLPLVVASSSEHPERCEATYGRGAAGWVVLDQADEAGAACFARYWLNTTLLPQPNEAI